MQVGNVNTPRDVTTTRTAPARRPEEAVAGPSARPTDLRSYHADALARADQMTAPPQSSGVTFRPVTLREHAPDGSPRRVSPDRFPGLPFNGEGQLDLNQLTPAHLEGLTPEQRRDFFRVLGAQSAFARGLGQTAEMPGTPRLDAAVALHLHRQDPSGRTAGDIFAASPETIAIVHRGLHGSDPAKANEFMQTTLRNLDRLGGKMNDEQLSQLSTIFKDAIQLNRDPVALEGLMTAADEGLARLRETDPKAADFNTGAMLGSVLAAVRDSNVNPWETLQQLAGMAGGPVGRTVASGVTAVLRHFFDTHQDDPQGLFPRIQQHLSGLEGEGAKDILQGFVHSAFQLGFIRP